MTNKTRKWEILYKNSVANTKSLLNILLQNRGIKNEKDKVEFINPTDPMKISIKSIGVNESQVTTAIKRLKLAKKNSEHVIIYGDYDADGITGTATLWETLHQIGIFVLPHIPERFSEGYGLNLESVKRLKNDDPKLSLIITVDHGITAGEKVTEIKKMGIDMIITDHHQKGKTSPRPLSLIYTPAVSGSALSWFFSREVLEGFKISNYKTEIEGRLQFAAIGTVADQLPLTGVSRSIVKYGLKELNRTKKPGLLALFKEANISEIGPYEINYIIAPRINSMGRLKHGLESLRLLCTVDKIRALKIAENIGEVNKERQKIVDDVVKHAMTQTENKPPYVIVLANEKYHEGVIGLAAAKLVEKFYRPSIVMSVRGDIAKASARSIAGLNIIETIRKLDKYYIEGGGHPMAAGFSIKTDKIEIFSRKINSIAKEILNDEILEKKLKVDCELDFELIKPELIDIISQFSPTGLGNPEPVFFSNKVEIISAKLVGRESKHVKLRLKQNEHIFDSIFFGGGEIYSKLITGSKVRVAYSVKENVWNGCTSLQLMVKDIKLV